MPRPGPERLTRETPTRSGAQETWFLRNASRRSNARVLLAVAREFDLQIPTIVDTYDCSRRKVASSDSETFHYDLKRDSDGGYSVLSAAMDPTSCTNGVLFSMHAGEGTWIFKGPANTSSAMCSYGGAFGHRGEGVHGPAFPVATARVNGNYSWRSRAVPGSKVAQGTPCVVQCPPTPDGVAVLDQNGALVARGSKVGSLAPQETHTYVDEPYLESLRSSCGWSRDNGIIELIPIAVVERRCA